MNSIKSILVAYPIHFIVLLGIIYLGIVLAIMDITKSIKATILSALVYCGIFSWLAVSVFSPNIYRTKLSDTQDVYVKYISPYEVLTTRNILDATIEKHVTDELYNIIREDNDTTLDIKATSKDSSNKVRIVYNKDTLDCYIFSTSDDIQKSIVNNIIKKGGA